MEEWRSDLANDLQIFWPIEHSNFFAELRKKTG